MYNLKRTLLHIPVGLLIGIPVLGWSLAYLFVFYERNEDRHIRDQAWIDTFGALIGTAVTILFTIGLGAWFLCAG